jgi:phage gp29-like protein
MVEAGASGAYQILMNELNNAIAIAILGQANTSQLPNGGGSRAALQVLNLIRTDILYYDMLRTKDLVNELIEKDFKINNNSSYSAPYEFEWIYDDKSDIDTYSNVFEVLGRLGVPVDKNEFYNKLALTIPSEENQFYINNTNPII